MPSKKSTLIKKPSVISKVVASFLPPDRGLNWETAAKFFTASALFLVPLIIVPWSNDAWEIHKMSALFLAILLGWAMMAVAMIRRGTDRWSWHPLDWLVLLFGLVATVSTITSVNWWTSLFGVPGWTGQSLLATWAFIGLYFLVVKAFHGPADRRFVWLVILSSLGISMVAQVFQFADLSFLPAPLNSGRWLSTIGNLNLHVTLIAAVFGAALLVLWSATSERWVKLVLSVGVLLSWIVLFFSGRALGWAVFALGMVVVVFHQSREERKIDLKIIIAAVIIAGLGLVAQLTNLASHSGLPSFRELTLNQTTTFDTTLTTLQHRPVLGTGPATWYDAFVRFRPTSFNQNQVWDLRFTQGGNAWAQLFATMGIGGALIFLGLALLGMVMSWRGWRLTGDPFLLISTMLIAVTTVTGFFTPWSFTLLTMFWVTLGLGRAAVTDWGRIKSVRFPAWGYATLSFGTVLCLALLVPFVGVYASDALTHRAVNQIGDNASSSTVVGTLRAAVKWNPHNTDAIKLLANAYGRQIQDAVAAKNTTLASSTLTTMTTLLAQAVQRDTANPQLYEVDNQILNALASNIPDAVSQAKTNFARLREIEPANPIHDVGYGQTVMALLGQQQQAGNISEAQYNLTLSSAIEAFDAALGKKPGYFQARLSKMQAFTAAGKYSDAMAVFADQSGLSPLEQAYVAMGRATVYAGQKKPLEAAQQVVTAIDAYPSDPAAFLVAADYFTQAEKKDEAKSILERGQTLFPQDAEIKAAITKLGS